MSDAVFDTSILVDHLRGVQRARDLIEKVRDGLVGGYISVITEAELFAGRDAVSERGRERLGGLISIFGKIGVDEDTAVTAGRFRREHGVALIDAIIAATAFTLRTKLMTQDIKDFEKIKEIEAERPY